MSDDTKMAGDAQSTAALEVTPKKRRRKSNGKSGTAEIPGVKGRLSSDPEPLPETKAVDGSQDSLSTQLIETVDGPKPGNGNGAVAARPGEVRPVKARLGDGHANGNGTAGLDGPGGNGNGYKAKVYGQKARVGPYTGLDLVEQ